VVLIKYNKIYNKETNITPEKFWFNRRKVLKGIGFSCLGLVQFPTFSFSKDQDLITSDINSKYPVDREITNEKFVTTYNNFYEFGSSKNIWRAAQKLQVNPWNLTIDGLVKNPINIDVRELIGDIGEVEERVYKLRCVEAWAMIIPWVGFQFSKILDICQPESSAKFIRMETFLDPIIAPGQKQTWYPWPYTEGITIEEAYNELTFIATGVYGKALPKQNGAPFRLLLPWKYGFKSIKSIKRISFTEKKPISFWETLQPDEYGFWANVNPNVPHPRWSQKTEKLIGDEIQIVPTQKFNGYQSFVAEMYPRNDERKYFF